MVENGGINTSWQGQPSIDSSTTMLIIGSRFMMLIMLVAECEALDNITPTIVVDVRREDSFASPAQLLRICLETIGYLPFKGFAVICVVPSTCFYFETLEIQVVFLFCSMCLISCFISRGDFCESAHDTFNFLQREFKNNLQKRKNNFNLRHEE